LEYSLPIDSGLLDLTKISILPPFSFIIEFILLSSISSMSLPAASVPNTILASVSSKGNLKE
jgi:hypothetical protein